MAIGEDRVVFSTRGCAWPNANQGNSSQTPFLMQVPQVTRLEMIILWKGPTEDDNSVGITVFVDKP